LVSTITAFSQINGNYNYSVAIKGYSLMQMPKIFNETSSDKFTDAYFNGVMVKFNDNQISYRLSGTFYSKPKEFFNDCESCAEANGKLVDYSFKIGFEKNFNYSRIQPYFAFDIGYRYNRFKGILENRNELKARLTEAKDQSVEYSKNGFLASPVIGVKINPITMLSIFVEGNLDFFYSFEKQKTVFSDIDNTRLIINDRESEFLLNPVSIGIQVHLGNNK
jgi:hypothetical protein